MPSTGLTPTNSILFGDNTSGNPYIVATGIDCEICHDESLELEFLRFTKIHNLDSIKSIPQ